MTFQNDKPETIMDIGPGSTSLATDPSRLYINLKHKNPSGTLEVRDYKQVRQELKQTYKELALLILKPNDICWFKDICTFNSTVEVCFGAIKRQNQFICNLDKLRNMNGRNSGL